MNVDQVVPRTFKVFSGGCHAVVFNTRGDKDTHITATLLTEDDENWFISKNGQFSSAWLPEVAGLFDEAHAWLEANAEPDIHNGRQYGWRQR